MRTDAFDYVLPPELIAQEPLADRAASRLMAVECSTGEIQHRAFRDLPLMLERGDLLVVNSSRVFPGRLRCRKRESGGAVELLLVERLAPATWSALHGGAKLREGTRLELEGGVLTAEVAADPEEGKVVVRFSFEGAGTGDAGTRDVDEAVLRSGEVPLPPYIRGHVPDLERYQTVYSEREISAAAPTAGLHFTDALLEEVKARGVGIAALELAVGLDTFLPVREHEVEEHAIHSEWYRVTEECARAVNACEGRVVAVGTTVVRALETSAAAAAAAEAGGARLRVTPSSGRTSLFITPGYRFRAVDAMLTNFHFPRSTLLMLVCAFGGTELVLEAYDEAIRERYRFYSFGDAMLLWGQV